jgi:hypothetical protein
MNEKDSDNQKKQTPNQPDNNIDCPCPIPCEQKQVVGYSGGNKTQYKNKNGWPNRIQAIFTALIFFVTTAYAIVAYYQWREIKRTSDATQIAANAAKVSADIGATTNKLAERNLKATQDQLRLDQRAWIGVKRVNVSTLPAPWFATITVSNTGKTPALHMKEISVPELIPKGNNPDFSTEKIKSKYEGSSVAPQTKVDIIYPFSSSKKINISIAEEKRKMDEDFGKFRQGDLIYYVHGTIFYDDVFHKHHWVTFCWYFDLTINEFRPYKEHNNTDDDKQVGY